MGAIFTITISGSAHWRVWGPLRYAAPRSSGGIRPPRCRTAPDSRSLFDELALLLDLEDVYWAKEGRTSVDAAVIIIGLGGLMTAGLEFWPAAQRAMTTP
ncbi:hypothetical protein [Rhodococcus oxybenzonivorans]|uniref:hypothetical protein n=1 Tax=Rhodococcus oxybenzonivorans TaxID=1990687 RepID=UPI001E496F3F|nr:hypothetical protein [Rhodococcus oxybenzonivorans]